MDVMGGSPISVSVEEAEDCLHLAVRTSGTLIQFARLASRNSAMQQPVRRRTCSPIYLSNFPT